MADEKHARQSSISIIPATSDSKDSLPTTSTSISSPQTLLHRFFPPTTTSSHPGPSQPHLLGLRGLFTLQSFLYTYLLVFAPVTVKSSANTTGPLYERILRQTLSVLLWNSALIYSAFILLSSQAICLPFLSSPSKATLASAVFRRGLRLWFPVAVALAITKAISSSTHYTYIDEFKKQTGNISIQSPYQLPNALAYFNSVFNLFWVTRNYAGQAGSTAFPGQLLHILSIVYEQSYTVYMTMLIIPYTRPAWRRKMYPLFILSAWWVQSWAWYSITGLFLADAITNMQFRSAASSGLALPFNIRLRMPVWIIGLILMSAGGVMQYLWTAWRPEYENKELEAHTGLYYSGALNKVFDEREPQARDDNYLLLLGLMLVVESVGWVRWVCANRVFVYLGRRSLSIFLTQSLLLYTVGIKLYTHLSLERNLSPIPARIICLLVTVPLVGISAELFYRGVDYPSQVFARLAWEWIIL